MTHGTTQFARVPAHLFQQLRGPSNSAALAVLTAMCLDMDYRTNVYKNAIKDLEVSSGYSRSSVKHALRRLIDIGAISRVTRATKYGTQLASHFIIHFDSPPVNECPPGSAHSPGGSVEQTGGSVDCPLGSTGCPPSSEIIQSSIKNFPEETKDAHELAAPAAQRLRRVSLTRLQEEDWGTPLGADPEEPSPKPAPKRRGHDPDKAPGLVDFFTHAVQDVWTQRPGPKFAPDVNVGAMRKTVKQLLDAGATPDTIRRAMVLCSEELRSRSLKPGQEPWKYFVYHRARLLEEVLRRNPSDDAVPSGRHTTEHAGKDMEWVWE